MADETLYQGQMRVGDLFAPFYSVQFFVKRAVVHAAVQPTGSLQAEPGRVLVTEPKDEAVEILLRSYVTSVTIKTRGAAATFCEVVMQPPYEDAIKIIDNQLIDRNAVVAISWGWLSNNAEDVISSGRHYFTITQPKLDMNGTDATITITGTDLHYSATQRENRFSWLRIVWPTDAVILEEIARASKLKVSFKATTAFSAIRLAKDSDLEPDAVEQTESDWLFFQKLCAMNNCTFFVRGNVVEIVDNTVMRLQAPFCRFVFFNQPQGPRDVPMYGYTVNALENLFHPPAAKQVIVHYHDPNTGDQATVIDPASMPDQQFLGKRTAAGTSDWDGGVFKISDTVEVIPRPSLGAAIGPVGEAGQTRTGVRFSVPAQGVNRDEHAKRVVRDAILTANTEIHCTIPGVPNLTPTQLVQVIGVPKVFGGTYFVRELIHKLDSSGYECEVTLNRDSATGDESAGTGEKPATGGIDSKAREGTGDPVTPQTAEDPVRPRRVG